MKERHGFVSNSSSSSFIIGIANATAAGRDDVGKVFDPSNIEFNNWYDEPFINFSEDGYDILFVKDLGNGSYRLSVKNFNNDRISCIAKPGDKIVALQYEGNEGDSSFTVDEYYLNYDIDLDWFEEDIQKQFELIHELGGDIYYGAARNG